MINIADLSRKLDELEAALAALRAEHEQEAEAAEPADVGSNPEVVAAAQALAQAVARAQGIDLPLQAAPDGASVPVFPLPPGMDKVSEYGGVGVAVMVAPPTEKARRG